MSRDDRGQVCAQLLRIRLFKNSLFLPPVGLRSVEAAMLAEYANLNESTVGSRKRAGVMTAIRAVQVSWPSSTCVHCITGLVLRSVFVTSIPRYSVALALSSLD